MNASYGQTVDKTAIRHAATVILLRDRAGPSPSVLMGQRGSGAAFMPNKVVFPGGAVDATDAEVPLAAPLCETCTARLRENAAGPDPAVLAAAAIRELWEETGQILGRPGDWPAPPPDWTEFAAQGLVPDASPLAFVFRAITPPGRPRRFDARFFLADADRLVTDPDDFSAAQEELSHLRWIPLSDVRSANLPFITEVVLAEVVARLGERGPPRSVPFFDNGAEESLFRQLGGRAL